MGGSPGGRGPSGGSPGGGPLSEGSGCEGCVKPAMLRAMIVNP